MKLPTREDIRGLAQARPDPGITLAIPTHGILRSSREDAVQLGRLLDRAAEQLLALGHSPRRVAAWLAPARLLTHDGELWRQSPGGLLAYLSPAGALFYRVPYPVAEGLWIADRFLVRPLAPLYSDDARFHVLTVSQARTRLFAASRFSVGELGAGLPQGLSAIDDGTDHPHEKHSHEDVFFGLGYGHDDHKDDIGRFLELLDAAVVKLTAADPRPLVVAGVEFVTSLFLAKAHHPDVVGVVHGNPDTWTPRQILANAWPVVEGRLRAGFDGLAERIRSGAANGFGAIDVEEVLLAAHDGRVAALMLAPGEPLWGRFDPGARTVERHVAPGPGDDDLVDLAAALTLRNGGALVAREVDPSTKLGALFRY